MQSKDAVDYEAAFALKMEYMRELFDQDGPATVVSEEFTAFVEANKHWLTPYAAFCVLRDRYVTADMSRWGNMPPTILPA